MALAASGAQAMESVTDGDSNLVTKPLMGRWSWSLGGESRKLTAGNGGSDGEIGFIS